MSTYCASVETLRSEYTGIQLPLAVERSNANNQCVLPFDIELCIATSQVRRHQWCWNISPQALITRPRVASACESTTKRIWNCRRNNNKIKTGFFFPPPKSSMHKITYWFFARINSIICFVKLWRSILIYTWSLLLTWTFFQSRGKCKVWILFTTAPTCLELQLT